MMAPLMIGIVIPHRQKLRGILRWKPSTIRGGSKYAPDYVNLPGIGKLHLTGIDFPTRGEYQGYQIEARGNYMNFGDCQMFQVSSFTLMQPVPVS